MSEFCFFYFKLFFILLFLKVNNYCLHSSVLLPSHLKKLQSIFKTFFNVCLFSFAEYLYWFFCFVFLFCIYSKRRARTRSPHGERETQKDSQAEDDLFQLPACGFAEALPKSAVPRPSRESRAGGPTRPHADTGMLSAALKKWSTLLNDSMVPMAPQITICMYTGVRNYAQRTSFCLFHFTHSIEVKDV